VGSALIRQALDGGSLAGMGMVDRSTALGSEASSNARCGNKVRSNSAWIIGSDADGKGPI